MTAELDHLPIGGAYTATASCIDLWQIAEGQFDLTKNDVDSGVEVVMWIEGVDSAGSIIQAGGGLTEAGNVAPIMSGDASHKSMYSFIHEEAKFAIDNFRLSPSSPQIGDAATIEVEVRNSGTMAGAATLVVKSVTDGGLPVVETTFSTNELGIGQRAWSSVTLEAFTDATTGMYYIISDNATDEVLYDGSTQGGEFNVKIQEVEDEPPYVILAIVAIIAVVIIVVAFAYFKTRESGASGSMFDDDDEYEDDVPQKAYAELPTTAPAANVSPEMARAMEAFPQWTQDEIQGYFDQGWSIESLQEWVNSQ